VQAHWAEFGRNFYSRYDYEGLETEKADLVFQRIVSQFDVFNGEAEGNKAEVFKYTDPVDGSVSDNQGWMFRYADGSRFIFRKSGTGSTGATIRIYLEKYSKEDLHRKVADALKDVSDKALAVSDIHNLTGRTEPTVIT
jgi:phosphoglucomutase